MPSILQQHRFLLRGDWLVLQTTSPSYLLLASLDATQAFAQRGNFGLPLEAVSAAKKALLALPGISLLEHSYTGQCTAFSPFSVSLNTFVIFPFVCII